MIVSASIEGIPMESGQAPERMVFRVQKTIVVRASRLHFCQIHRSCVRDARITIGKLLRFHTVCSPEPTLNPEPFQFHVALYSQLRP